MFTRTNWLTASLAGIWSSSGLLGFNAVLRSRIGDSSLLDLAIWVSLTVVFVVIPLQVAVIGKQSRLVESLVYGAPSEQMRYRALVGRCLLWLIIAIGSGCLLEGATIAFTMNPLT